MRRVSGRALWIVFTCSLIVLVGTGIAADAITTRYADSEDWVSHTHEVQTQLVKLRADLLCAEAARLAYVVSDDEAQLPAYNQSVQQIPKELDLLRRLTLDNHSQQEHLAVLRPLIEQRLGILEESVDLVKHGVPDQEQQRKFTETGADLMTSIHAILEKSDEEERALLVRREYLSDRTYTWARMVLIASFFAMALILLGAFAKLLAELRNREQAEESVRKLSGHVLRVQDEERRRIARELHDSLGQILSSVKMTLEQLGDPRWGRNPAEAAELISSATELIQQSITETRTLSYLLHPPLLDEFGIGSAAKWYIEGFSARSKIAVKIEIPPDFGRMPEEVEIALFRLLQESLTNIHRHSGSAMAEVCVRRVGDVVSLNISDHGKGMPPATLAKFQTRQAGLGVGLAGMRERVHQLGGKITITSNSSGTTVNVDIPLPRKQVRKSPAIAPKVQSESAKHHAAM